MKKKILMLIVVSVTIIIVPIFLDYCILGNKINSNVSNEIWMAFFGSYFGGLFGAVATMMVLFDTQNSRRKIEEKNKKEQEEERKLSIRPCLQVREKVIGMIEHLCSGNNAYYISYEKGEMKQRRNIPQRIEYCFSDYYIIETELRNVGMGSAISLNAYIDEKQFLFNDSLGVEQVLKIYFLFKKEELYHKEVKVTFEDTDIMGLVKYKQEEIFLMYRNDNEILKKYTQFLTLPQVIE